MRLVTNPLTILYENPQGCVYLEEGLEMRLRAMSVTGVLHLTDS